MPVKKSKRSKGLFSGRKWFASRKSQVITVMLVFGLLGTWSFLHQTFAATNTVNYWGSLSTKNPSATYQLTTGAGNMDITFSNNTADLTLRVKNSAGEVVGMLKSIGKKDVYLSIPVSPGTYSINLSADSATMKGKKGYSIHITYPVKDLTGPTAAISKPLNNEVLTGVVDYQANASDDTAVSKVEFYVDGVLLDTDTTAPYGIKWDTTLTPNGSHTLTVKSYDTSSNIGLASGSAIVENVAQVTSRFPGDPNPKASGNKAYWGASGPHIEEHEAATGTSVSVHRTFYQWDHVTNLSSNLYQTVQEDHAKNRLPHISIKTAGWQALASGQYDAQLDAMLKKLDSYGKPVWLTVHHEPEGGGDSGNTPDDSGGAPAWRAMQIKVRQRITSTGVKNIGFLPILMSYTWNPGSGRNPEDWWVPGIWDAYFVDSYQKSEAASSFMTAHFTAFVAWVEAKGLPFGLGEWANQGSDTQAANEMQVFWDWSRVNNKDMLSYSYYDTPLNPGPEGSHELAGEALIKYRSILKNDSRVQRINDLP